MNKRNNTAHPPELSILIPCLNEEETIGDCIREAKKGAMSAGAASYEVLVADNGSRDGSVSIAENLGARVVHVSRRGYGAALMGGLKEARGDYVIMADGDGSYDLGDIGMFLQRLRAGVDLVMGTRLRGTIEKGAMPALNRFIGNPSLTLIGNLFFRTSVSDFHCGMRGLRRKAILDLQLVTNGMEYASEMVIRATLARLRIEEVPIRYRPDGRSRPPHLRPWRDGWRHLRFMLLYSPRWLFFYPGMAMILGGAVLTGILLPRPLQIGELTLDIHTLMGGVTATLVGSMLLMMGLFARVHASRSGLLPPSPRIESFIQSFSLEVGLAAGLLLVVAGAFLYGYGLWVWGSDSFGPIVEYQKTLRIVIAGTASGLLGMELFFSSFVFSLLASDDRQS